MSDRYRKDSYDNGNNRSRDNRDTRDSGRDYRGDSNRDSDRGTYNRDSNRDSNRDGYNRDSQNTSYNRENVANRDNSNNGYNRDSSQNGYSRDNAGKTDSYRGSNKESAHRDGKYSSQKSSKHKTTHHSREEPEEQTKEEDQIKVISYDKDYRPKEMKYFTDVKFPQPFYKVFDNLGFKRPTPIQKFGITVGMDHKDIIGIAKTGSGKTLAFTLPGLCEIIEEKKYLNKNGAYDNRKTPLGLVIAPTRELAMQIYQHAKPFCSTVGVDVVCCYGGSETYPQREELARGVDLLVATPGRLLDFVDRNAVSLKKVIYFVIDEADRMLDMGFIPQVKKIVEELKPKRQTLLFSATWPKEVESLSEEICKNNPVKIKVGGDDQYTVNKDIKQFIEVVDEFEKNEKLKQIMRTICQDKNHKVLVFVKTKKGCDRLSRTLDYSGYDSAAIHGDKAQNVLEIDYGYF